MLRIYNMHLHELPREVIAESIFELPPSDFRVAAVEYFARKWGLGAFDDQLLTPSERAFLSFHGSYGSPIDFEQYTLV